ncbi:MAG: hypothetical protein IPJ88_05405 [Myxococcales bacterium]|nr:MAG: hypothetical protein IPJ88_05405 [Myxococcales bacterium]
MNKQRTLIILGIVMCLNLGSATFVFAQSWPSDTQWDAFMCQEQAATDTLADTTSFIDHEDIVGRPDRPAVFWHVDDNHLFFRMRLDANPLSEDASKFQSAVWGVELDTDCNRRDYELLLVLDGSRDPQKIVLQRNDTVTLDNDPNDPADSEVLDYETSTHARTVQAQGSTASNFGDNGDFFIDWAVNLADLELLGIDLDTELGVVMGTSSEATHLNGDLVCLEGAGEERHWTEAMMDRMRLDGQTVLDDDGDGLTNCEEAYWQSDAQDNDTDDDGVLDEQEVQDGTDPTQDNNAPGNVELRGGGGVTGCGVADPSIDSFPGSGFYSLALLGLVSFIRKKRGKFSLNKSK